ncbi:Asp-tRNA(Asn)/Glu-tRNA(Gln) amidotransferase subunit GatC [Pararhodospirillum oryzae]|uniref:Aspartyl/glutamyl-tRNA(Asn/Gln) amidotransferase subunit C n=1 Tax=Pararhodospirillum oryzae TaxID=478448 RepID=A0A512H6S6_9PROT|nr:Asp-tRNA(Asn)/Glu-tRNA(Gln) amidotransferase subunit GatC [Pararhodospirillum oryzae]GEO81144.1 aspartyl/glutamyl-tRNA(Asn/Gln) amidotransferase subunit C [Pararhodospirillum oryzae]
MALDKTTVANIAFLARLDVPQDQQEALAGELSGILTWIEQLGEVDTQDVAPMTCVADLALAWREDVITDGGYPARVLANAPEQLDGCYVVPKVVE